MPRNAWISFLVTKAGKGSAKTNSNRNFPFGEWYCDDIECGDDEKGDDRESADKSSGLGAVEASFRHLSQCRWPMVSPKMTQPLAVSWWRLAFCCRLMFLPWPAVLRPLGWLWFGVGAMFLERRSISNMYDKHGLWIAADIFSRILWFDHQYYLILYICIYVYSIYTRNGARWDVWGYFAPNESPLV